MLERITVRTAAVLVVAAMLVSGCTPPPTEPSSAQTPPATLQPVSPPALRQRDPGAALLAAVDNARQAIGWHDLLSATNDIQQALGLEQLRPTQSAPLRASLHSDAIQVDLLSAGAQLNSGDTADADAHLAAIQRQVPLDLIPSDLPLLKAAACLELAKADASLGLPQLQTQLHCAQLALNAWQGPSHVDDAQRLAMQLERYLTNAGQRRLLLPVQLTIWQGQIARWAGSDRW